MQNQDIDDVVPHYKIILKTIKLMEEAFDKEPSHENRLALINAYGNALILVRGIKHYPEESEQTFVNYFFKHIQR